MLNRPLERVYGKYRIIFQKDDHISGGNRPTPHVEVWKGSRKVANYDIASQKIQFKRHLHVPKEIQKSIQSYINDPQVTQKIKEMIEASYFDLSKPAGEYGGIPHGFKAVISVEYTAESLRNSSR